MLTGSQHEASQDVAALVRDAQAGDEGALNHLVATHLPLIYNILGRALHTPADVDDLVQETMLRVVRGLPSLREPDRFRSWAVAIAYRQLQQHARRRAIDVPHRFDVLDVPDPSTDFAERSVAEIVLTGQRRDLVRAARWLDPADRQLLALWWQEVAGDLSRAEVAAALSLDAPHTAVRLQRMKTRLEEARAVVGALDAAPRCPGLAVLAQGWDGDTTSVWRKRFTRHTRDCPTCGDHRSGLVPPERLLPGLGVLIVPHGLLDSLPGATTSPVHAALGRVGDVAQQLAARPVATGAGAAALAVAVTITCVLVPWSAPAPLGRPPAAGTTAGTTAGPSGDPPASATGTPSASAAPRSSASDPAPSPAAALPGGATGGVSAADIFVAPGGSDSGDGSLTRPYATLGKAVSVVRPGQTISLRGGTYRLTEPVAITTSGTAEDRITLSNYREERPVIDASALPAAEWAITQQASHWTVQGFELFGSASHAYVCRGCGYSVFRRLSFHDNARSGLVLRDAGTTGNTVLDSDFFNNHDDASHGAGGIGLGVTFGSGEGNTVRGCRFYHNATDGLDLGGFASPVTVEGNWSYGNGVNRWKVADWHGAGNGFTLGGGDSRAAVAHRVSDNAAWDNTGLGFNDEGNPGRLRLTGNTAFRNAVTGFSLSSAAAALSRNVAAANGRDTRLGPAVQSAGNSWDAGGQGAETFASTDPATAEGERAADGTLPATAFLATRDGLGARMTETP